MSATIKGISALFGSGFDINEGNLLLPNETIHWHIMQSNEDFVRCVLVLERDGRRVIETHHVMQPVEEGEPYTLDYQVDSMNVEPDVWFSTIGSGRPPLNKPVLIWNYDAWAIRCIRRSKHFQGQYYVTDQGSTSPVAELSDNEYNSLRWCYPPPHQPEQQTETTPC